MKKSGKNKKDAGTGSGMSLNLVLWFSFSLFAIIVVLLYVLVQNVLVDRRYREQTYEAIRAAGDEMSQAIEEAEAGDLQSVSRKAFGVSNRYSVSIYLVYEDGTSVFPDYTDQKSYPSLAAALNEALTDGREFTYFTTESVVAYATTASFEGQSGYLFVSHSLERLGELEGGMGLISLMTALFAMVLAFVVSGFVAMLVTKPVTEVTERAKELARGNYDLNFKETYYCSEINELSEALDYARSEISKADKMQKELIANVSHDFKTPLTMIKAYASMIREISGEDKKKRDAHAQIIIDESDRLAALVGDLLDLSRIRAGLDGDEKTVFNLSEEVYRIAGRFDYLTQTQGYTIDTEVEDGLYVCASRARIEQVLYNLIGNAVNYTGEDKKIRVRLFAKEGNSRFEVIDSGKGIPEEEIATIWDRYYRSSETHKRPVKGTGLGLSIVKEILQAHDYPFGVISEVGKGSCFWVTFPAPEVSGGQGEEKERREKQ